MKNKTISFIAILLVLDLLVSTQVAYADTTGTVAATVMAKNISLTVAPGTVTYGNLALGASRTTLNSGGGANALQTVTNNGNVLEDFTIKGANSVSGDWILDSSNATASHYVHEFSVNGGSNWTALTLIDAALGAGSVASNGGTQDFDLKITTPQTTSGNGFNQQTVNVTVTAAEH